MAMSNQIFAKLERAVSLLVLTFVAAFAASTAQALPHPVTASYARGAQFEVTGYDAAKSTLSDFPVLVRIADDSPSGFAYSQLQSSSDGTDLCFIDMDGNGLPFEIDTWNTNGTSLIWVKLPTMEQGTQFVMCWGGATSGKTVCPDNPFAGYKGVWHMNTVSPVDASGSGNDGTASNSVAVVAGKIGSALYLQNKSDCVTCGRNQSNAELKDGFTVEAWVNADNLSGNHCIFGKDLFISFRTSGNNQIQVTTPGKKDHNMNATVTSAGTWWHAALSFQKNTSNGCKVYVNGTLAVQTTSGDINDQSNATEMWLGRNQWGNDQNFQGFLDEMRLSVGIKSADWIAATYATQSDPAFLRAGAAQSYEKSAAPDLGLVAQPSAVHYTNATLTVTIGSLGMDDGMNTDASWVDPLLVVSMNDDLSNPLFSIPLERTSSVPVSIPVAILPLVTNMMYHAKLVATNSFGVAGESGVVHFMTHAPGAPSGRLSFLSRGFTTFSASGCATDFGTGATSAMVRLEASADDFVTTAASDEVATVLDKDEAFTILNLTSGTEYALRLRIENDWGLVTYVPLAGSYSTRDVPIAATGIGYVFSSDGSTVDVTFGITDVFDGSSCTATLVYDGRTLDAKAFSAAGTLSWSGVAAASGAATAAVTVTADVYDETYEKTWSLSVKPGSAAHVMSSLSDLANVVFRVGDSAVLPEPTVAGDYYLPLDVRVFSIDGTTLTALEPGFSAVCVMERDAATGAFVRNEEMSLAVCIPKTTGRVFLAEAGNANMNWSETAKWRCLTDHSVTETYPNGGGDVVMVPLAKDKVLTLDTDATVGALYIGWNASAPASGTIRFAGDNCSLTFCVGRRDGEKENAPGLFRISGLNRSDVDSERPNFTLGSSGSGNRLVLAIPDGLVLDGGKHPDVANTTLRNVHNRINFRTEYGDLEVPAGRSLKIINLDHAGWSDGQMYNCSTFIWKSGFHLVGQGSIIYETAALGFFDGALADFGGALVIRQKQRYAAYGIDSRGGGFWLKANVGREAKDATFVIEGEVAYDGNNLGAAASKSIGVATWGSSHGSGSWGPGDNSLGGAALVMAGGTLLQRGNNTASWANNGIVTNPNRSDVLVVSNGFSRIEQNYELTPLPTNRLEFTSLRHSNRGTLRVSTTDTGNYQQTALEKSSHCIIHNAEEFAIGGGGADGSRCESIIPWVVAHQQSFNRIYFPYFGTRDGETNCLVLSSQPTSKDSLAAATDQQENVFVNEKTIALDEDLKINALYLNKNWSKGTALGAGKTLTVTSGGVVLEGDRAAIGQESDFATGTAGTLKLPNEGYLYSTRQSSAEPNEIWASIVAPKGLAISFPGFLRLGGDQTGIDEEIAINGCDVTLGSATTGCTIDVPVRLESGAATLRIAKGGSFCRQVLHLNDHATVGPKFVPADGTEEVVHKLYVNGANMPRGTYGATGSGAQFIDDNHFSGTGWVRVLKDDLTVPLVIRLK